MAVYLAFKEVWRNRGRFFLFSLVIALITTLVLFIAALAEGLALANRQFLQKLDAELLVFQKNVDTSLSTSRIGRSKVNDVRRIEGVRAVGSLGLSSGTLIYGPSRKNLNISLIGIEPGEPGTPLLFAGRELSTSRGNEVIIDDNLASRAGVRINDVITIKTIQGTDEKFFELLVVGMTDGQQYLFQPSVFLPYRTWDRIRPQGSSGSNLVELTSNVIAVRLDNPGEVDTVRSRIESEVEGVEAVDIPSAIEAIPGYRVQQSTLNTQSGFTLLIGILVIGGFFQIQLLQKVPQIGVLKAIGTSNVVVAAAVVMQIILVTTFGVILGGLITLGLAAGMPANVPIIFNGSSVILAIIALLSIGPLGGLVSVRLAISIEPLAALGLSS